MADVAVFGITGRMGQTLVRALRDTGATAPVDAQGSSSALRLSGAIASPGSARLGADAAQDGAATGVAIVADLAAGLAGAAVALDFSTAQCVAGNARACVAAGVPLLVGATGFDAATRTALEAAAVFIPVLIAPNTSVGITVLTALVARAARALGTGYDVEISEAHHRMKRDAPSGTALVLGETVAGSRGHNLSEVAVFDRHGNLEPRQPGQIGFSVLRAGDIVGDHTVSFAIAGERVELTHRATDRMTFARGALRAAAWLMKQPPGLYRMAHVLGVEEA